MEISHPQTLINIHLNISVRQSDSMRYSGRNFLQLSRISSTYSACPAHCNLLNLIAFRMTAKNINHKFLNCVISARELDYLLANIHIAVFCVMIPYSLVVVTYVLEAHFASIFRIHLNRNAV